MGGSGWVAIRSTSLSVPSQPIGSQSISQLFIQIIIQIVIQSIT